MVFFFRYVYRAFIDPYEKDSTTGALGEFNYHRHGIFFVANVFFRLEVIYYFG